MVDAPVQQSYGRCCLNPTFVDRFYEIFLASHPAIAPMFGNTDFAEQQALLRTGVSLVLMQATGHSVTKDVLSRIAESHGVKRMNIDPNLYQYWIDSFVAAVKECDPQYTAALGGEWRKVLRNGVDYIVAQGSAA